MATNAYKTQILIDTCLIQGNIFKCTTLVALSVTTVNKTAAAAHYSACLCFLGKILVSQKSLERIISSGKM